ncbi:hypothetical protein GEV33_004854 [Tenebrio molitor]|uniref:Uncharacterized protein n=1 Tax=Tenebrio molitor TaxID=7067 RepID=A0A8J6HNY3_TENMO|nr:hypothetical protein GEV33_004854 [Tenebrio molitor]
MEPLPRFLLLVLTSPRAVSTKRFITNITVTFIVSTRAPLRPPARAVLDTWNGTPPKRRAGANGDRGARPRTGLYDALTAIATEKCSADGAPEFTIPAERTFPADESLAFGRF